MILPACSNTEHRAHMINSNFIVYVLQRLTMEIVRILPYLKVLFDVVVLVLIIVLFVWKPHLTAREKDGRTDHNETTVENPLFKVILRT